jgi:hypothetical protein
VSPRGHDALWTCPKCGERFVTANLWHSCGAVALEAHFARAEPQVRLLFDALLAAIQRIGPVHVIPQKTRFAGCVVRRRHLRCGLYFTERLEHPRIVRIEAYGPRAFGHFFELREPGDLDATVQGWLRRAYAVGEREHLARGTRRDAPTTERSKP